MQFITKKLIADHLGITVEYMLKIEKGERNLSKEKLDKYKQFLQSKLNNINGEDCKEKS